jgi:transposase
MKRGDLTHTQWERLQPLLPPQKPNTGRPASDHRRIINGIRWILRTGAPWCDLPERYGPWGTVASRFYRWRKAGIWQHLFESIQHQVDAAGKMKWTVHDVDGTIVRAHQHAAGSPRDAEAEALGRSQGGLSTKIHIRAAGEKQVMHVVLTPGQRHEALGFEAVMAGGVVNRSGRGRLKYRPGRVVGDKAYSSGKIRGYLQAHGIRVTIPHRLTEHRSGSFDRAIYRLRE